MEEKLLRFLAREREERIEGTDCALRLLSARETLALRRALAQLDCADGDERALRANAELVRCALVRGGETVYPDAETVERTLSVGEINALVERYARLDGVENPSAEGGREAVEALKKAWSTRPMSG